ncbi:hypothetical protein [Kurthia massiliensis]|uniref:hypothetical protein n=1 Tax=Kurthia massiliensis TaxID=1033739 RepID=UPI000288EB57|nr:hypothetical protein [Kurthia massiliensis]
MEQQKTNKKPLLYALIVIIAAAVIFALYFYMLKPQMDKRAELEEQVAVQRTEAQSLKTQHNELKAQVIKPTDQEKNAKLVPQGPSMDTLVDDLQAAEAASATQITDFTFNAYAEQKVVAEEAKVTTALTEAEEKSGYAADATPVSDIPESTLPKHAKMITVQLAVSGYSEADIRNFIDQVEKAQRMYIVEKVKYEAPDAEDTTSDDIVAAKLQLTTFYYEAPVVDAKDNKAKDDKSADDNATTETNIETEQPAEDTTEESADTEQ